MGECYISKPQCGFGKYSGGNIMLSPVQLVRLKKTGSVFRAISGAGGQRETSWLEIQDLVPPSWTPETAERSLRPAKRKHSLLLQRRQAGFDPPSPPLPRGASCQSCEWPARVIYTSPRESPCHVAGKWRINAANHAAGAETRATVGPLVKRKGTPMFIRIHLRNKVTGFGLLCHVSLPALLKHAVG